MIDTEEILAVIMNYVTFDTECPDNCPVAEKCGKGGHCGELIREWMIEKLKEDGYKR